MFGTDREAGWFVGRKENTVSHSSLGVAQAVSAEARLHSQLMRCLSERWGGSNAPDSAPQTPSVGPREETTRPQAFFFFNSSNLIFLFFFWFVIFFLG